MMRFYDEKHKDFVLKKYAERNHVVDDYYRGVIYTLGMSDHTRDNFEKIFDMWRGEMNFDALRKCNLSTTSEKVTRMAFSLWDSTFCYESREDRLNDKFSIFYNPSTVFRCDYAPFFYEAIKLVYPHYTKRNGILCEEVNYDRKI